MMNIKQLKPSSLAHHIHVRDILYILKNREEFEGGLHEKMKGKGGERRKKKRVIKHTLKYLYEA